MSTQETYLIGDVQGCFDGLIKLLTTINPAKNDQIIFLGDVVNRGKQSLQTLNFIKDNNYKIVLGNHDFHLLACFFGVRNITKKDTFSDILNANNRNDLIEFLLQQKILIYQQNMFMVHAGISPIFSKNVAISLANKIENNLVADPQKLIKNLYVSNDDDYKQQNTIQKLRYALNSFMRMRFCNDDGKLEFKHKNNFTNPPYGFKPWFADHVLLKKYKIYFGHWSTLRGVNMPNLYPLDTGYIWGGSLSAIRISDNKRFSIK